MGRLTITRLPAGFALAAALMLLTNPWPGGVAGAAGGLAPSPPDIPMPDHVVIVILENHSCSQIIGSSAAPYINSLYNAAANKNTCAKR